METHDTSDTHATSSSSGGTPVIERFFARLGLAATALALPILVLALDVFIHRDFEANPREAAAAGFAMNLVSHDGRAIGNASFGVEMTLSPVTFYRNRASQEVGPYRVNSLGLRGGEADAGKPRVLVLGGSAAFGLNVPEPATFVARLGKRHPGWSFLNAGTVGFVSEQELGWTFFELQDLEASVVVDFTGWNDLYNGYWLAVTGLAADPAYTSNCNFLVMEDRLARLRRIERSVAGALGEAWRTVGRKSSILRFVNRRLRPAPGPAAQLDEEAFEHVLAAFTANLERLREVVANRGAHLLVVLQPEVGQTLSVDNRRWLMQNQPDYLPGDAYWRAFPELYAQFRRRARAALEGHDIEVVDASEYLIERGVGSQLFLDPVHLNPEGHARMAELISAALAQRLAVE